MWESTISGLASFYVASNPELGISGVLESINTALSKYVPKEWGVEPHRYLIGLPRRLNVLTPSVEAVALSGIRSDYKSNDKLSTQERAEKKQRENAERLRLALEEGRVCFDLFADFAGQLLHGSNKIRQLIANAYPTFVLDEFPGYGTRPMEWHVIQALGRDSVLIALADPNQRIFDFIGADPNRLNHFEDKFQISKFDLGNENHRSRETEILYFGNDILKGKFSKNRYEGVAFELFEPNNNQAITKIVTETLKARKRLIDDGSNDWSLAVLVPTKRMTRQVSDAFREPLGKLPRISHHAAVDMEAAILAAEIIAYALQIHNGTPDIEKFITLQCSYYQGKGGESPTQTNLNEASRVLKRLQNSHNPPTGWKKSCQEQLISPYRGCNKWDIGTQLDR